MSDGVIFSVKMVKKGRPFDLSRAVGSRRFWELFPGSHILASLCMIGDWDGPGVRAFEHRPAGRCKRKNISKTGVFEIFLSGVVRSYVF